MTQKAIFLDRDNTLIPDPGYIRHPDQVQLLDGTAEALKAFRQLGYKLVLITNQSAVARGMITEQELQVIHDRLEYLLAQQGTGLDRIYYCPYHPEGSVEKYRQTSVDRKPNPGMLLKATQEMGLNLEKSWCIGDRPSDIEAGVRAGCRTIMINAASPVSQTGTDETPPDFIAVNLREAVNIVKQQRHQKRPAKESRMRTNVAPAPKPGVPESPPAASAPSPESQKKKQKPASPKPVTKPITKTVVETPPPTEPAAHSDQLLQSILEQMRGLQRNDMFDEFSVFRLIAGIIQMVVVLCLVLAVWLLMGADKQYPSVFTALGFAMVFQTMSLTFFNMRNRP